MSEKKVLERVIQLFSTMTEAEKIGAESELIDDLEINSMDILYLVSCIEEEFSVKIPESAIRRMFTVGDVAEVICELIDAKEK